jgi:dihydroxy-acid dehydratase
MVAVLGGSTNAVMHLIAMAHSVDIEITLDDFQRISDKTPLLADLKPSGKYLMEDLHTVGGVPAVMKYLLKKRFVGTLFDRNWKNNSREFSNCS